MGKLDRDDLRRDDFLSALSGNGGVVETLSWRLFSLDRDDEEPFVISLRLLMATVGRGERGLVDVDA
jgi:hypothetical protein